MKLVHHAELIPVTARLGAWVFLLAYGVATAVGSFGGGRFADRNPARSLIVGEAVSR